MTLHAEIRTKRLLLRPFQQGDVADALAYRNDEQFAQFLPHIPQPFTRQDAEAFVARNMSEPGHRSPTFAVILEGTVIGTVNLELNAEHRTAMLGYAIGRSWWGQGVACEAAQAVMAWGVASWGLVGIWASTDTRHRRSQRVLEKLGMRREGISRRSHLERQGEVLHDVVYALSFAAGPTVPGIGPVDRDR